MGQMIIILNQFFQWVLSTSVMASVMVGFILIAKLIFKDKLNIRWQYLLWFLVIARLILPWTPESSFSVFNLVDLVKSSSESDPQMTLHENGTYEIPPSIENQAEANVEFSEQPVSSDEDKSASLPSMLAFAWLIGIVSLIIKIYVTHKKFSAKINSVSFISDRRILSLFNQCRNSMLVQKNIPIMKITEINGPTLYGSFRPRLLLPEKIIDSFTDKELMYIFTHELSHFKRKDIMVNWLMTGLLIIHWFNPILWYAYYLMREDQEMACDALALTFIHPNESTEYGYTIIKFLASYSRFPPTPGVASFSSANSQLRRRIKMIKLFSKKSYKWSILGLAIIILLSGFALTNSRNSNGSIEEILTVDQPEHNQIELTTSEGKKYTLSDTKQEVIGIEGKVAILGYADHFVAEDNRRVGKLMIFYWGNPSELVGKNYRIEAMNSYGGKISLSEGSLSSFDNRANAHTLTKFIPFPTEGKWQLSFYVEKQLHGEFTLEVLPPFPKTEHYILRASPKEIRVNENSEITIESSWRDKEEIEVRLVNEEGEVVDQGNFIQVTKNYDATTYEPIYFFGGNIKFPKQGTWTLIIDGEKTKSFDIDNQ